MGVPQFFCEGCGHPVPREASACPFCGKTFSSVRCPSCGFSGDASLFTNGCPSCGYLAKKEEKPSPRPSRPSLRKRRMPLWLYTLITCVLIGILVVLIYIFMKL
ncbi:MAG TPA: zinc ribbon domain-containing protein [Spirochaetia bacterium]|nr:zinc ribbon domain-containing protein [Spirochaetia bacterium]